MLNAILIVVMTTITFIVGFFTGYTRAEDDNKNDDIYNAGDIIVNLNAGVDDELISIQLNSKFEDWLHRNNVKFNIVRISDEKNTSSNEEE